MTIVEMIEEFKAGRELSDWDKHRVAEALMDTMTHEELKLYVHDILQRMMTAEKYEPWRVQSRQSAALRPRVGS